ncbi:MAG: TIGR01777 family protein [Lentisphaeraceae bacterium]|nr:TIGR01777 family protein [Lentisphaeraceae bacterium]
MKRIVIAGGNGYLGQVLQRHHVQQGNEVCVLTRGLSRRANGIHFINWNARDLGPWTACLEKCDVLINLCGRSVDCRYNRHNRNEIYASRLDSTKVLGQALVLLDKKPVVWLNASSATIYADSYNKANDEAAGLIGEGFSVDVCQKWEKAFFECSTPGVRQVALRTSLVLGKDAPFIEIMKKLVRLYLGGRQGSGQQKFSWLHEADWIGALDFIIGNSEIDGAINVCSPKPTTNVHLMKVFRECLNVKVGLPASKWLICLGAFLMRTEAELPLKSRFVVPCRLLEYGYEFSFSEIDSGLADVLKTSKG